MPERRDARKFGQSSFPPACAPPDCIRLGFAATQTFDPIIDCPPATAMFYSMGAKQHFGSNPKVPHCDSTDCPSAIHRKYRARRALAVRAAKEGNKRRNVFHRNELSARLPIDKIIA